MAFNKEADFEEALIEVLTRKGWESKILKHYDEKMLLQNWADILFNNNRDIDRLNEVPLTDGEMQQIIEQIKILKTPLKLNGFINGKTVSIKRDNPLDKLHNGKEISLKIYDRAEIAGGQSRYQIVEQPEFPSKVKLGHDRRGDLMLLINGMPVIHIELKKSGVNVSEACFQIEKYAHENLFSGLFSLMQIFVAMTPEETLYFANPGPDGKFNRDYFFHWADRNNTPINNWKDIAESLLSIPMAHQLIGFYTVADDTDQVLKVMRSYQYYAASAIADKVAKHKWDTEDKLGGYIWHTTGSGKTMTSFKSAQLIANSGDADKVVFLTDRIELGTQSLAAYKNFADDSESVQATEDTNVLIGKLKSNDPADVLIVTSMQKMSRVKLDVWSSNLKDIEIIGKKRLVFIIDEAHRSTFGDMLIDVKTTFPKAMYFGFTGTPIQDENQKKMNTTATVLGDELHRYSIADGIRDKNVLGFDVYQVKTFKDLELRNQVALMKAKADSIEDVKSNPNKEAVYDKYMDASRVKMYGYLDYDGKYVKGIEDYVPTSQYYTTEHRMAVVEDIRSNWDILSKGNKFHAIFATSSICEAIEYYRLIKQEIPQLKAACLFDPSIDNNEGFEFKEDGLLELLRDYNTTFFGGPDKGYDLARFGAYKKDISLRLAHKTPYATIQNTPEKQLNLLIVVDQMLTGYDSKWVNTLYLDKKMQYENIIQAFSRTNRLFGKDKPFGIIRYYRYPNTMEVNINNAVKLYSGDKVTGLFVDKLPSNIDSMNYHYSNIIGIFRSANIINLDRLPDDVISRVKFAQQFNKFNLFLDAAKVQGFVWSKLTYDAVDQETGEPITITSSCDEDTYLILCRRYLDMINQNEDGDDDYGDSLPFDIDSFTSESNTRIDNDYMNSRFEKYLIELDNGNSELIEATLNDLHNSFAMLSQEKQKYANIFLHDIQMGNADIVPGKLFMDYVVEYEVKAKDDQVYRFAQAFGLDESKLRKIMTYRNTENNINEYGRLDEIKNSVDLKKASATIETLEGKKIPPFKVKMMMDQLLRSFILSGGFDLEV